MMASNGNHQAEEQVPAWLLYPSLEEVHFAVQRSVVQIPLIEVAFEVVVLQPLDALEVEYQIPHFVQEVAHKLLAGVEVQIPLVAWEEVQIPLVAWEVVQKPLVVLEVVQKTLFALEVVQMFL